MLYKYKSFTFICFTLSVITKEVAATESNEHSAELFDDILYQRLNEASDDIKEIYFAWSIIKQLVETNKTFLYRPHEKVIDTILYDGIEYELTDNFDTGLLKALNNLINHNKRLFSSFYEMGADKYLDDLIKNSD